MGSGAAEKGHRATTSAAVLLAVGLLLFVAISGSVTALGAGSAASAPPVASASLAALQSAPRAAVPVLAGGPAAPTVLGPYSGEVSVFVSFPFSHPAQLAQLLSQLSDPSSPQYHHYLTRTQFDSQFAASNAVYADAESYLASFENVHLTTFEDRSGLLVDGPAASIASAFGVAFESVSSPGRGSYYQAVGTATLPAPISSGVRQVLGLSSYLNVASDIAGVHALPPAAIAPSRTAGYPTPLLSSGVQYLYGSDLQVAYDEQSLLQVALPTHEVVATILWAGCTVTSQPCPSNDLTAPFIPSDVYNYYNQTIPAGQPHASVYGVPFDGAPAPGPSASSDVTNAALENTLDLSMVGSTAPGATVYNVYGLNSLSTETDAAMAYILNPTSTPGLNNVSVVSNSWGGQDRSDAAWNGYMQEAAARGITVLASSGDSGDNPGSSVYPGTNVEFPSSVGFDTYGTVGIGGTTLTVNMNAGPNYLHTTSEIAWYDAVNLLGSAGGTSGYFPMPTWQASTEAAGYISAHASAGQRGTPDLSAIGNNTIIELNGATASIVGTSIACPVIAGLFAEIDTILARYHQPALGFVDPAVYAWANSFLQSPVAGGSPIGADFTGSWHSVLPANPTYDVVSGSNYLYPAAVGYDLVTGWGSLDAYNFTNFVLNANYSGESFSIQGVRNTLSLSGLNVTSFGAGSSYNASVQQNFFVANSLGAPLYWVQNVIYILGAPGAWQVNYTGWVIYPFYGLAPQETVYTYNFPVTGSVVSTPLSWTITSWISGQGALATMNFAVNSQTLQLPLPGGQFIIGGANYSYFWQGNEYENGPYPGAPAVGGLAPQFGLVGGPTLGNGEFAAPTAGTLTSEFEMTGSAGYAPTPYAAVLGISGDQTGEVATNLLWTPSGGGWALSINPGSAQQGVYSYATPNAGNPANQSAATYSVVFAETALPLGASWSVNLSGDLQSSTGATISFQVPSGSYTYSISTSASGYVASPSGGVVVVNGAPPPAVAITFQALPPGVYVVTFRAQGLTGELWSVTLNGTMNSTRSSTLVFSVRNGTLPYTIAAVPGWTTPAYSGVVVVAGANPSAVVVAWSQVLYTVSFTESGLASGTWQVTINATTLSAAAPNSIAFQLPNGTFQYQVGGVSGYTAQPTSGSLDVNAGASPIAIAFSASGGGGGGSGFNLNSLCLWMWCGLTLLYFLLVIVIVAVAIAIVGVALGRRRERRERAPPAAPPPTAGAPATGPYGAPPPPSGGWPPPPPSPGGAWPPSAPPPPPPGAGANAYPPSIPPYASPSTTFRPPPPPPPPPRVCPTCHQRVASNDRFCRTCGQPLPPP